MQTKVLLVEDERIIALSLRKALSDAGFAVQVTHDGTAGWHAFQETLPDVVVADIRMPGLDCFDLLQRVKETDPRIAFILYTGFGDLASAKRAIELGADGYLEKMIDPDLRLADAVRRAAEKQRLVRDRALIDLIAQDLSRRLRLDDMLERFLQHIRSAFSQVDAAFISLYRPEQSTSFIVAADGMPYFQALVGPQTQPSRSVGAQALRQEKPVRLAVGQTDWNNPQYGLSDFPEQLLHLVRSHPSFGVLGVPITAVDRPIGSLTVVNFESPDLLDEHLAGLLTTLCRQVGLYLDNARLFSDLQAQTGRLQAVLDGAADGILLVGQTGQRLMSNARAKLYLGEPGGTNAPSWSQLEAVLLAGLADQDETRFSFAVNHATGGTPMILEVHAARVWHDGTSIGVLASLRDVTLLHHLDRRRTELLSEARHHIETPLDAISAFSVLLTGSLHNRGERDPAEILRMINQQAQEVKSLIRQTLQYSQVKEELLVRQQTALNLSELVIELARETAILADQDCLSFDCQVEPELWVLGNHTLKQAFRSLLENARKFTPVGGHICCRASQEGHQVVIDIQDTGRGIPQSELPDVFKPYYRASTAQDLPGTGLGLSIVRDIIDAHRGRIQVESEPGQGTRFTVLLPAAPTSDRGSTPTTP
jgi:signal transduction histidine kinase/DNA-binding NarL/FixJ family response regulator